MRLLTQLSCLIWYVWTHQGNQGQRLHALGRCFHWQFRKRFQRQPWVIDTVFGRRLKMLPDSTICSCTYYAGLFEWDEMNFLLRALRPDDGFVDIGANVGIYTLLASARVRSDNIWAAEANPLNLAVLNEQLAINQITGVKILPYALAAARGRVSFKAARRETGTITEDPGEEDFAVEARTLDELISPGDLSAKTFAKMDVEGCEVDVLLGAKRLLSSRAIAVWVFELSEANLRSRGHTVNALLNIFRTHGYKFYAWSEKTQRLGEIVPSADALDNVIACHKSVDWLVARLAETNSPTGLTPCIK